MELKKIIISGFKSVQDKIELIVDPRVTIFIGANDHGKSNLLEAILRLNDDKPILTSDVNWEYLDSNPDFSPRIEWYFNCTEETIKQMSELVEMVDDVAPAPLPEKIETTTAIAPIPEIIPEEIIPETIDEQLPINSDNLLVLYRDGVNNPIKILSSPIKASVSKEEKIIALKPRVELFIPPQIDLKDETTLIDLETDSMEFMQGIFRLAGIWQDRTKIFTVTDQTSRQLDEASERLTCVLNSTYNQGRDLKWKLKHEGVDKIRIEIEDPAVSSRYTRPSLKSSGFRTYFLLSMITYARSIDNKSNSFIYLFDEPGTNLHPMAQIDLQRTLETLSDKAQIFYTTHSLFLINKNYPDRNTVIVKTTSGTKVNLKPFQKNWKAVRESLGILLSNNFLIAEKTVLVEGPSDVIYLLRAIKTLKHLGKIDIDLNDLSIVDAGDESNYIALAKLMLQEGRSILALTDGDGSGAKITDRLKKICSSDIKSKHLIILQLPDGSSSEDIFANLKEVKQAIINVTKCLIDNNTRTLKDGIELEKEVNKIKSQSGKTLGRIIDEKTKSLFVEEEKVSKLSIALEYEDINKIEVLNPKSEEIIESINNTLKLRAEKAYSKGVFEEVTGS